MASPGPLLPVTCELMHSLTLGSAVLQRALLCISDWQPLPLEPEAEFMASLPGPPSLCPCSTHCPAAGNARVILVWNMDLEVCEALVGIVAPPTWLGEDAQHVSFLICKMGLQCAPCSLWLSWALKEMMHAESFTGAVPGTRKAAMQPESGCQEQEPTVAN